jgi:hypothetical protein
MTLGSLLSQLSPFRYLTPPQNPLKRQAIIEYFHLIVSGDLSKSSVKG